MKPILLNHAIAAQIYFMLCHLTQGNNCTFLENAIKKLSTQQEWTAYDPSQTPLEQIPEMDVI